MGQAIKTALVSYGMSGKVFHAPLLKAHKGFEVVKVMQRSSETALQIFPNAQIVRTFDELINDAEIELVIVNTPDDLHYEQARTALEAGKHVVVEKPFVQSVRQGEDLIALAKERNLALTVFQNRRWDNGFLTVQKVLSENILGRLVEFESRYNRYRTFVQESWKEERQRGTGILHNLGAHLIDQALVLFGMPTGVNARLLALRDGSDVDDYFDLRLIYKRLSVTLKAGYLVREETPCFMLHGVRGSFVKYGLDPQEEALKEGQVPTGDEWGRDPETSWGWLNSEVNGLHVKGKVESIPGNYGVFYHNLYEVIRNKAKALVQPSEALDVIRIMEAAIRSNRDHSTIFLRS